MNFSDIIGNNPVPFHRYWSGVIATDSSRHVEGPEGVKWEWDWPKIWVGKWDLIHWDWDFRPGNGTQNTKWEREFCFNPLSKIDNFGIKLKQKSNNSVMQFYPIKN